MFFLSSIILFFIFYFYMKPKALVGTGGGKFSQLINPTTSETIYNTTHIRQQQCCRSNIVPQLVHIATIMAHVAIIDRPPFWDQ